MRKITHEEELRNRHLSTTVKNITAFCWRFKENNQNRINAFKSSLHLRPTHP